MPDKTQAQPSDVEMLQTSAALENAIVALYQAVSQLPYIGGEEVGPLLGSFVHTTLAQHIEHAEAFNAAITSLGGDPQDQPDPKYAGLVLSTLTGLSGLTSSAATDAVVALASTVENVAAQTYVANCSKLGDAGAKRVTASIMGVEAQHVAVLRAVAELLKAGDTGLLSMDPDIVVALPSGTGSAGFPDAFFPTAAAASPTGPTQTAG